MPVPGAFPHLEDHLRLVVPNAVSKLSTESLQFRVNLWSDRDNTAGNDFAHLAPNGDVNIFRHCFERVGETRGIEAALLHAWENSRRMSSR